MVDGPLVLYTSFLSLILPLFSKAAFTPLWWAQVDSNHRPHAYQACALTTWAMRPFKIAKQFWISSFALRSTTSISQAKPQNIAILHYFEQFLFWFFSSFLNLIPFAVPDVFDNRFFLLLVSCILLLRWWRWGGSNSWPPACKAGALPAELHPHVLFVIAV